MVAAVLAWCHPPLSDEEFKLEPPSEAGVASSPPRAEGRSACSLLNSSRSRESLPTGGMGPFPINVGATRSVDCQSVQ